MRVNKNTILSQCSVDLVIFCLYLLLSEKDRVIAEANAGKEAWQAERDSIHQLELQSVQMEREMEREKHFSAVRDLEQKHADDLAAVRKSLEQSHEAELVELDRRRRSDVAEVRAELEQRLAGRETELGDELHSVASDAARLRAEVNDLTLSKSKVSAEYERHIDVLKRKLDSDSQQLGREMSELECERRRQIESLESDLEFLRSDHEKMSAELTDSLSQQNRLNSLRTKFRGDLTHLAGCIGRLRREVADVLRRSAVDLKNDATAIEREMQRLRKLHSSTVAELIGRYGEEIAYCKDQLHAEHREHEQMVTDHEAEMSRLRRHVEESLTTQHGSVVTDLTERHTTEVNQLRTEINRLREKCDSLSIEISHYQHELKRHADDVELLEKNHRAELQALNKRRDEELSEFQGQKDDELVQSVNSLEAKHADEMSKAEASYGARIDSLTEELAKLRFDSEQTVADVNEEKENEIVGLNEMIASLQKQNESVSLQLEFKAEEIMHLQDQLNLLGQEHGQVLQEIEQARQELEQWKQQAAKLEIDNATLVEQNAKLTEDFRVQVEMLQSEKDRLLEDHAHKRDEEFTRFQSEIDAVTKASEEMHHLKDAIKEQLSEATANHLLQIEQLKQQHYEEKIALEKHISSLQENVQELKIALAEKESSVRHLNQLNETNILLRSETADLREHIEQLSLKLEEEASEAVKLQMAKGAVDERLSEVENQLQEITDEKERLVDQCRQLEAQIEELRSSSSDIERQFLDRAGETWAVESQQKKQVSQRVQDLIEENKTLLSQNSDLDETNTLLQNRWLGVKQEHESLISELEAVKLELNNVKQDGESAAAELQRAKIQCTALAGELDESRKLLHESEQQVQNKLEQEVVLNDWILTLEDEKAALALQLEDTKRLCDSVSSDLKAAKEEESLMNMSVRDLTEQLKERASEVELVRSELAASEEHCALFESQLETTREDTQRLEATLESVKRNCDFLESELENSQQEGEQLKIQVQDLQQSSASLETKLQSVTMQLLTLEQETQSITEQKNSIELHLNDSRELISSLQSQLVLAKEVGRPLQEKLVLATDEIDTFHGRLQELEGVVRVLKDDKQHLAMQLNSAQDQSSAMAERLHELETGNESLNNFLRDSQELCDALTLSRDEYQNQVSRLTVSNEETTRQINEWQERYRVLSEQTDLLRMQLLRAAEVEDRFQLQTAQLQAMEEQSRKWQAKHSEIEQSNNLLNEQLQALTQKSDALRETNESLADELGNEKSKNHSLEVKIVEYMQQLESFNRKICELSESHRQSQIRLENLQEENETLKVHMTNASGTIERLELHVSEATREKESLSTQLESVLERQKVLQEQDNISQAELRVLRQRLSDLSQAPDVVDAATDIQSELQAVLQEQDSNTKEELPSMHEPGRETTGQQTATAQQDLDVEDRLQVLEARLTEARATPAESGDGANFVEEAQFLLDRSRMLQEKVVSLQQLCDKHKEELEVTRRKIAWLRKSRQVTFADEVKQTESVAADAVDENSEEEKKLKRVHDCHASQLTKAEALLEEKVDLLLETEERCANTEADRDKVASQYAGLAAKHDTLLKELENIRAELENERSRVVNKEQVLEDREVELLSVNEKLKQVTESYSEMCKKQKADEKSAVNTEAQLLSKSYLLKEAEERLAQQEAVSLELTKDLTERMKRRDAGISSHEELIMDFRAQLFAEQERVAETDKLLQENRTQLGELEEQYRLLKLQHETSVSAVDERINTQVTEMKRKCIAKVRSIQAEYEAKLSDSATALSETKSAVDARVNELERVVHEQESEIETLQSRLHITESGLEKQTSDIQVKLDRSQEQLAELESFIADTDKRQKEALDAQAEQLNRESGERLADLKRRAEMRLGQIKRQQLTEKESAVGELNRINDELRARLAANEDELHDALEQGRDAQNKILELMGNLSEVRRVLHQRSDEMNDKESTIDSYRTELDSLENKLQNNVSEIDELTASLRDAEQSQTDLRQQLSATELARQQLAERCEVEVRTAALDSEQELERLKAEYDEKLRDTEAEHNSRIKQLVKEFRLQMAQKEKEFQTNYNEVLGT